MTNIQNKIPVFPILLVLFSLLVILVPEFGGVVFVFEMLGQYRLHIVPFLLFICIALLFKRHYLLSGVQLFLVVISIFIVTTGYSTVDELKTCTVSENIRVLSFNTYFKNPQYSRILEMIELYDADIVLLEEVQSGFYNYGHKRLLSRYPFYYADIEKGIAQGKSLYSRYPIEEVGQQPLPSSSRRVLQAKINIGGKILNFIGIHTYSPKNITRINDRNSHIIALKNHVISIDSNDEYIVVAGDFNTVPWHKAMRQLKKQTSLRNDRFYNMMGSWPSWLPDFLTVPIDHIFYNDEFNNSKYYKGLASGSDHYPIYVDLELCK